MRSGNLFESLPDNLPDELIEVLAESGSVRIERIVSTGHHSPDGFWYDQDQHEWVIVLQGQAKLMFKDDPEPMHLQRGDYVLIQGNRQHRVEWTDLGEPTVWLAVFFD